MGYIKRYKLISKNSFPADFFDAVHNEFSFPPLHMGILAFWFFVGKQTKMDMTKWKSVGGKVFWSSCLLNSLGMAIDYGRSVGRKALFSTFYYCLTPGNDYKKITNHREGVHEVFKPSGHTISIEE